MTKIREDAVEDGLSPGLLGEGGSAKSLDVGRGVVRQWVGGRRCSGLQLSKERQKGNKKTAKRSLWSLSLSSTEVFVSPGPFL